MGAAVYIGFGSNLGDRQLHFERAVEALRRLPGTAVVRASRLYETDPVSLSDNGPKFLNAVIAIETDLPPHDLARYMQAIELALGKSPSHRSDMSRAIDLDLLLYGEEVSSDDGLIIPHPRMHERGFVLVPLAELAAEATVPTLGRTVGDLVRGLPGKELAGVRPY